MSQTEQDDAGGQPLGADKIILGVLAVLIFGALFYVMSQRQQALRSSPSGLDGLQVWLSSEGQNAQSFVGGWPLSVDDVGLLIVPLYDTTLDVQRDLPASTGELIVQQDEYDLTANPIQSKAGNVPMIVVLPKWRSGMRLTGLAHPFLLVEPDKIEATLNDLLDVNDVKLSYGRAPFTAFPDSSTGLEAEVYAAQMFSAESCIPILGTEDAMILGDCALVSGTFQDRVFVLSDPDLINNHGLALGDNAFIVRDFVASIAADQQVVIDYSRRSWLTRAQDRVQRDRTWADLMRFFSPPFTLMWVGLVIAMLLTLWRAALRFGPLIKGASGLGARKMLAIGARARLMRLSNRDGALIADYSKARIATTAAALFGPAHARQFSSFEAFLAYTQRRHPKHAKALATVLNMIGSMPAGAPPAQAMAAVAKLDRLLEQITHDT